MENVKWYSSTQVSTAKHVSYPQLTATYSVSDRSTGSIETQMVFQYDPWIAKHVSYPQLTATLLARHACRDMINYQDHMIHVIKAVLCQPDHMAMFIYFLEVTNSTDQKNISHNMTVKNSY